MKSELLIAGPTHILVIAGEVTQQEQSHRVTFLFVGRMPMPPLLHGPLTGDD